MMKNSYYSRTIEKLLSLHVIQESSICEISSGKGKFLPSLRAKKSREIDISSSHAKHAESKNPQSNFVSDNINEENFDYVIVPDIIGQLKDIQGAFQNIQELCSSKTRVIVTQYNRLWYPIIAIAERLKIKRKDPQLNWLSKRDAIRLIELADYELIFWGKKMLLPVEIPVVSFLINNVIGQLPIINRFCLIEYMIFRPKITSHNTEKTVSVIVPARNERGNIKKIINRIPKMGKSTEVIFVEGHSADATKEEIEDVLSSTNNKFSNMQLVIQDGKGKADAVRKGFSVATGDIIMIQDADLTVSPEDLPKFYEILTSGKGEYIHGTRLIYPMENGAMQFLNFIMNYFFGQLFSWLLGQKISDTLCGTKVIWRKDYIRMMGLKEFFKGDDPFGDFDLIYATVRLNLKIVEIPVHYKARSYGSTNIRRFRDGILLFKMVFWSILRLKFS